MGVGSGAREVGGKGGKAKGLGGVKCMFENVVGEGMSRSGKHRKPMKCKCCPQADSRPT